MSMSKNLIIAISQAKVSNIPASHELMMKVGSKACITTASHPGFLGFEQLIQTGIHAMAGRSGGGSVDMGDTLNPVALYQYTVWKDVVETLKWMKSSVSGLVGSMVLKLIDTQYLVRMEWASPEMGHMG